MLNPDLVRFRVADRRRELEREAERSVLSREARRRRRRRRLTEPTAAATGMEGWIAGLQRTMAHGCKVLLISGSLRNRSTNSAVLKTAVAVAPDGIAPALYEELGDLPPFNPDDDEHPLDPAVADLRGQIRAADAILLSTPEYAGALPGSFKNLLDWTIGDDQVGSIYEKPVAWINASPRGAVDAHESLRKVLGYAHASIVESACIHIEVSTAMLDDDGLIPDADLRHQIAGALVELVAHGCREDVART